MQLDNNKNSILIILDGWGHGQEEQSSAIAQAKTPFVDSLYQAYPNAELITHGEEVGLPKGQMGNSEVGHLNIGAGRIVYQELLRINNAIKDKSIFNNHILNQSMDYALSNDKALHLMGLVSDGGVHSHINHLKALCDMAHKKGLQKVFIHAFTDGRDTSPKGGIDYLKDLLEYIKDYNVQVASLIGRYYAMDRDNRWERIQKAYDLLIKGEGEKTKDILSAIHGSYDNDITDEFILPHIVIDENNKAIATIQEDDAIIFFNFRTDRPRQLTEVLTQNSQEDYGMHPLHLHYTTMVRYDEDFKNINVVFDKDNIKNTIGEVLERASKTQIRIAETEKYPHVTFFFSGGREEQFKGESRILIPSPKVATYDLQPEMSANEITSSIMKALEEEKPNFVCLNYANTDMVGHTGDFKAAMKAAETVDNCLEKLVALATRLDYAIIIIADHGNSDYMINEDGSPNTAHTTNLVPIFYINNNDNKNIKNGILADVAPTILDIMDIKKPKEMDGESLLV